MKTSKIITSFVALNLVIFMSIASIANPLSWYTGETVKTEVKKQINNVKSNIVGMASTTGSENEFSYLRFDASNFSDGIEYAEIQLAPADYLRFDVNAFIAANDSEISELPLVNEFGYLRFDVNNFTYNATSDFIEMPVTEFNYLRFDVNQFSGTNTGEIDELPVIENATTV
jgi:hypothetical protein